MKSVIYDPKLEEDRELRGSVERVTRLFDEAFGPSAGQVDAQWELTKDGAGRSLVILRISDWSGSASAAFTPSELGPDNLVRLRLYHLWGDLLQERSHRQLEELQRE